MTKDHFFSPLQNSNLTITEAPHILYSSSSSSCACPELEHSGFHEVLQSNVLDPECISMLSWGQGCEAGDLHPGYVARYDEDVPEDASNPWAGLVLLSVWIRTDESSTSGLSSVRIQGISSSVKELLASSYWHYWQCADLSVRDILIITFMLGQPSDWPRPVNGCT